MRLLHKGILLAAVHVAIVSSLGGKLLWDRARLPRAWILTRPADPNAPIRGRYVSLQVIDPENRWQGRDLRIAFFIPEHVPDPSRRAPGEELWAEVTIPRKGPPRPIRLGVKKNGALTPLPLN